MRFVYFLLIAILWWNYWRALVRARDERTPFTPIMGWLVGLGYFVVAPLTILVINGGYRIPDFYDVNAQYASVNLSDIRYVIPMLVIWISLLFSLQSLKLLRPQQGSAWKPQRLLLNVVQLKKSILLTFGLSLLDWVFTIWRSGGLESFLISHWYLRQEEAVAKMGDLFVLYAQLSLANQIVFIAAAALLTARQLQLRKFEWRFSGLIMLGLIMQMVMSGNRIFIALYGLSFLTACWIYQRKRLIAFALVSSPLVLLFFSAWASFRHDLSSIANDLPGYLEQDLGNRTMTTLMDATEGANIMLLLHVVNDFGYKYNYFYGLSYTKAITFVFPRSVYSTKPENFPALIAKLYEPGQITSLGGTQLSELYANFGPLIILTLPLITVLISFISDRVVQELDKRILLSAALFLIGVWFARSSFEDNLVTFLFAWLLIWGLRLERGLILPERFMNAAVIAHS